MARHVSKLGRQWTHKILVYTRPSFLGGVIILRHSHYGHHGMNGTAASCNNDHMWSLLKPRNSERKVAML